MPPLKIIMTVTPIILFIKGIFDQSIFCVSEMNIIFWYSVRNTQQEYYCKSDFTTGINLNEANGSTLN